MGETPLWGVTLANLGKTFGDNYDAARKQGIEDQALQASRGIADALASGKEPDYGAIAGVAARTGDLGTTVKLLELARKHSLDKSFATDFGGGAPAPASPDGSIPMARAAPAGPRVPSMAGGSAKMALPADPEVEGRFIGALRSGGLTNPYGLAAMAAYANAESRYSPSNITGTWSDPSERGQPGTSGGILSWRGSRLQNMQAATRGASDPVEAQAKFALTENPDLTAALQNAKSPDEAHALMANAWKFAGYDRPGGENDRRRALVRAYVSKVGGGDATQQAASSDEMRPLALQQKAPAAYANDTAGTGDADLASLRRQQEFLETQLAKYGENPAHAAAINARIKRVGDQIALLSKPQLHNGDKKLVDSRGRVIYDPKDGDQEPVDAAELAKGRAKKQADLEAAALKRGQSAQSLLPSIQRAKEAWDKLAAGGYIDPKWSSTPARFVGTLKGSEQEQLRREFEAAMADIEARRSEIIKGQGAVDRFERQLIARPLPKVTDIGPGSGNKTLGTLMDAASAEIEGLKNNPLAGPTTLRPERPPAPAAPLGSGTTKSGIRWKVLP